MKYTLTYIVFAFSSISFGQTKDPRKSFDHLSTFKVKHYDEASFSLDTSSSIIYNETFENIKNKPERFYLEDFECEDGSIIIANILLDKITQNRAILTFGVCPEFEFYMYDLKTKNLIGSFSSVNFIIPGNGYVYTSGHLNEFDLKRKYSFNGKSFSEDKQPFYYVGLKSLTLNDIKIYSDKDLKKILAVLPRGYEIEVLLAEHAFNNQIYLVRTSFGLTGWAELKSAQYQSIDVEGLFYNND